MAIEGIQRPAYLRDQEDKLVLSGRYRRSYILLGRVAY